MPTLEKIAKPWELERDLKNEHDIIKKIDRVAQSTGMLLDEMEITGCRQKIDHLVQNPFDREIAYNSLFALYENIHSLASRVVEKIGPTGSLDKVKIGTRSAGEVIEEAVNRMIFQHERDELLAPVSAELGRKKGDYGPAMYSEVVKRAGRNLIMSINSQINELLPTATKICQGFSGVSNRFVTRDTRSGSERQRYEEVWLIYQAEKAAKDRIAEIASITKDKIGYFQDLLDDFEKIRITYREKMDSLIYLKEESGNALDELLNQGEETTDRSELEKQIVGLDEKIEKLQQGDGRLHEIERLLLTLKNLIEKFPQIQDQIELFLESDFQARSVYKFLEEINQEMKGIFGQQNLQAFEVIAALVFKLKSTSLMYEDANYYQATVRMSDDVTRFLQRTLEERKEKNIPARVVTELKESGIEAGVMKIHDTMNRIKALNNRIHLALVEFGDRFADREGSGEAPGGMETAQEELKQGLGRYLEEVKKLSEDDIAIQYRKCQRKFQQFTEKNLEEKHIGEQVLRGFLDISVKGGTPPMKKEELLNFQKFKLYTRMMPNPDVQAFYSKSLKRFMRGEHCEEVTPTNIRLRFVSEITRLEEKERNDPTTKPVSKHERAIRYIAENLTPKEVESLARFVPCMPRNELRLTYPPGKLFIDIAEKHMDFIRKQSLRQFVLINPGEERKNENEITFKELAGRELIKKAYGTLFQQLQPVFDRIKGETAREEDFVNRERNKWRKELDQVILFLQNQIDAARENMIDETRLRRYNESETFLLSKHISPDQFDKIESLLGRKFELERGTSLADVVLFLVEIIKGFYRQAEKDELVKISFEEVQEEKRKLHLGGKTDNIDRFIKAAAVLGLQKKIDDLLAYWEYNINKMLPSSEQVLKEKVDLIDYSDRDLVEMAKNVLPDQLRKIRENLGQVRGYAEQGQLEKLLNQGRPLMKIVRDVYEILEKDEAMVLPQEENCRERLVEFAGDDAFKGEAEQVLSQPVAQLDKAGDKDKAKQPVSMEESAVRNINKLLTALNASASGVALPSDLPVVTRKNLKNYAKYISEAQIGEMAALVREKIADKSINAAEKRLLIISYQHMKENPGSVVKEDRKQILMRYKKLHS